jgi:hypothetical protein
MLKVAVLKPVLAGVKVTVMVQLAPAVTLVPHVLLWANSLALVPAIETPLMLTVSVPLFDRVNRAAGLALPVACPAKLTLEPDRVTKVLCAEDAEFPPPHPIQKSIAKIINTADASIRGGQNLIGAP